MKDWPRQVLVRHKTETAAVLLLCLLTIVLRFWNLGEATPGIFRDELEKGYTAYELWHTGRHGVLSSDGVAVTGPFPLFIETFAGHDRTSAIYHYAAAPFVGTGGLSAWTVRLPAALAGSLAALLVWGMVRRKMGKEAALIALAVLALHPTAIIFSRWAQQGSFVILFTLAGIWAWWEVEQANPRHRRAFAVIGGLLLGLAAYSYAPARLVVPLIAASFLVTREKKQLIAEWKNYTWGAAMFAILVVPLFVYTLTAGSSRLERVGIFAGGVGSVLSAYFSHFSPLFWFIDGDANPRHGLPANGFAGAGMTLLTLGGIALTIQRAIMKDWTRARDGIFLLLWLLAAPTAAALTIDAPHTLRANLMIPAVALLAGYFWTASFIRPQRFLARTAVALLLLLDATKSIYGIAHLQNAPPYAWETGVQEAMHYALAQPGTPYLSAAIPYAPYVALFAEETPPEEYQESGLAALRTQIVPPAGKPQMRLGDVYVGPPDGSLPIEMLEQLVLIYTLNPDGTLSVQSISPTDSQ